MIRKLSVLSIVTGLAVLALTPAGASAKTWSSFLSCYGQQSANGGNMRAKCSDAISVSSSVAPLASVTIKGSTSAAWIGADQKKRPPKVTLTDKITVKGVSISSVTVGSGGWSVTGGSTQKVFSYKRTFSTKPNVINFGHVYSGLKVSGALTSVSHTVTASGKWSNIDASASDTDTCSVFNICR